jgi:hypothetical protein
MLTVSATNTAVKYTINKGNIDGRGLKNMYDKISMNIIHEQRP